MYAVVGVVLGSYFGKLVFDKIPAELLRKIIYVYMIISGLITIFH